MVVIEISYRIPSIKRRTTWLSSAALIRGFTVIQFPVLYWLGDNSSNLLSIENENQFDSQNVIPKLDRSASVWSWNRIEWASNCSNWGRRALGGPFQPGRRSDVSIGTAAVGRSRP